MTEYDKDGKDVWQNAGFANAIHSLLQNKEYHIEYIQTLAELRWVKYNALIEEGFSKTDTLYIITNTEVIG